MKIVLSKSNVAMLKNGATIKAMDLETLSKVNVAMDKDGKLHIVISTAKPYTCVKPYTNDSSALNLTEQETKECMKAHKIVVARSSGYKEGEKVLTRAEQIAIGKARLIEVSCVLIDGCTELDNPSSYNWFITKDETNALAEVVPFTVVE